MTIDLSVTVTIILGLLSISNIVVTLVKTASAPGKQRDERLESELSDVKRDYTEIRKEITEIKQRMERYDETIDRNLENINSVRKTMLRSTAILLEGVKALQVHAIDGNNTKALQKSCEKITQYIEDRMEGEYDGKIWE